MKSNYPNTFYRVSLKAIIRNTKNEVLVVKEKSNSWSLPGGGWDNGESQHDALSRELHEEIQLESAFTEKIVGLESMYVEEKQAWLLWLVFELNIDVDTMRYGLGADADEAAFINPDTFKGSSSRSEKLVYRFATRVS
jgi:ADP-ribose pyrophosphatase YjhB (NUDIX family)